MKGLDRGFGITDQTTHAIPAPNPGLVVFIRR
jgi:hypothetical protein